MEPTLEHLETCDLECEIADRAESPENTRQLSAESEALDPYRGLLTGLSVWDAHAHVGCDIDGTRLSAAQVVERLDLLGVERAVVFPMNDPRQGFCFQHPNDLVWAAYRRFPERLIPFFRLNPNFPSREEYERRVEQGFRGIKLHPRSQSFSISQPEAMELYTWAEADGLPVLLHTGRGAGDVVPEVRRVVDAHPYLRLILGHSALHDLPECCAQCRNCDWVLFDTSTLDRDQLRGLLSGTDPRKVTYGSDMPFSHHGHELALLLEVAEELGLSRESLELILGGNLRRWLEDAMVERGACALTGGGGRQPPSAPGSARGGRSGRV